MFARNKTIIPLVFLLTNTAVIPLYAMETLLESCSYLLPPTSPIALTAYDVADNRPIRVFGNVETCDEAAAGGSGASFEPVECCICTDGQLCREDEVLACGHAFHTSCATTWMNQPGRGAKPNGCPLCRESIAFLRPLARRKKTEEQPLTPQAARERELVTATRNERLTDMQKLLASGVKANVPHYKHATLPLIMACQKNRIDMVKLLLNHHASTEAMDREENTALAVACWHKNTDIAIIDALLAAGASIDVINHRKKTPLADACNNRRVDIVLRLLNHDPCMDETTKAAVTALTSSFASPGSASSITAHSSNELDDDPLTI